MKRQFFAIAFAIILILIAPNSALAAQLLVPGGQSIALELSDDTVTVAAFDDAFAGAAKSAGLRIGDQILSIDGQEIACAQDVRSALSDSDGKIEITILRGSKRQTLHMETQNSEDGPRLGVFLRQGVAGIGTVTYYDPDTGEFAALGHGVSDATGNLAALTRGSAYSAAITSVKRGKSGEPGQLRGSTDGAQAAGSLVKNTSQGVFGILKPVWRGEPLPVAEFDEIHTGSACIRSTVAGSSVQEYSVEIIKIYPQSRSDGRNFLLKVTDPALLEATGGIVQGMSGSPILQDGRLVGAVTHVLVGDPTAGYGIFIGNMLSAAA